MNSNSSTKKSVNRARKANGKGNKSRPNPSQRASSQEIRQQSNGNGRQARASVASARKQTTIAPKIRYVENGCIVAHRELIFVVAPQATNFSILNRLRCNPASAKAFPWLSGIAPSYETYKFRKLRYEFITRAPSNTPGSFLMAPDYDAADGNPNDETVMAQYKGCAEDAPWKDITMVLKPELMNRSFKAHFTCSDSRFASTTQDVKTLDCAQVFFASDADFSSKWGKLWVEYEVELMTPQSPSIGPTTGGLNLQISNVRGDNTTLASPFNSGTVVSPTKINTKDPLLQLASHSVGDNVVGTFLRDFSGIIEGRTAAVTGQYNTTGSKPCNWKLNSTFINNPVGGIPLFPVLAAVSNVSRSDYIDAKAGDVLSMENFTSTVGTFTDFYIDLALSSLSV